MDLVGIDHLMKDDAAAGALHSGFLFWVHRGDWVGSHNLGLWSNTDIGHLVSFNIVHNRGSVVLTLLHGFSPSQRVFDERLSFLSKSEIYAAQSFLPCKTCSFRGWLCSAGHSLLF
jgi:hypothetical protein